MNRPRLKKLPFPDRLAGFVHPTGRLKKAIVPVFQHLLRDESGQDLIEYALVAAVVGLGAVTALKGLSNVIGNTFNKIGTTLAAS